MATQQIKSLLQHREINLPGDKEVLTNHDSTNIIIIIKIPMKYTTS